MTEETKNVEVKQECFCKKRANDVLVIAIGTFVGVYCALSLFAALHKPCFHHSMMYPGMYYQGMHRGHFNHHQFPPMGKMRPDKFQEDFRGQKPSENKD